MYEELIKTKEELNAVAAHLRTEQNLEELDRLAEKWFIPLKDTEDFISGKLSQLAKIGVEDKSYSHAEEKLIEEMWHFKDDFYAEKITYYLLGKSAEESFEKQVLLPHKSLRKCMEYITEQAYENAMKKREEENTHTNEPFAMPVREDIVYQWAAEYYLLDDAETEAKKREEERQKIQEERERAAKRKASAAKRNESAAKAKTNSTGKKANAGTATEKEEPAPEVTQLSLFDTMQQESVPA